LLDVFLGGDVIGITDLEEFLGIEKDTDTPLLTALELAASDFVTQETERYFDVETTHVEVIGGSGNSILWLNENPATITSVEERLGPGESWTAITEGDADGWERQAPNSGTAGARVLRKYPQVWRWGYEYRVTYDFGYDAGDEPPEIRQAVKDLVALRYSDRGRQGLKSERIGDYSYTTLSDAVGNRDVFALPGLARTLGRWRKRTRTVG
jgi:hypothetical protein